MNLIKSIESLSEVRWTWHLAHSVYSLPLRLSEVWQTSSGLVSPASPMLFCFTGLGPDKQQNLVKSDGIRWKSDGLFSWVCWNWLGPVKVHWNPSEKGGECKVHDYSNQQLCSLDYAIHQPHSKLWWTISSKTNSIKDGSLSTWTTSWSSQRPKRNWKKWPREYSSNSKKTTFTSNPANANSAKLELNTLNLSLKKERWWWTPAN